MRVRLYVLSNLELPALPYTSPIIAISGCLNITRRNHPVASWEGDYSCSKVNEGPLGYAERKPFDFTQSAL